MRRRFARTQTKRLQTALYRQYGSCYVVSRIPFVALPLSGFVCVVLSWKLLPRSVLFIGRTKTSPNQWANFKPLCSCRTNLRISHDGIWPIASDDWQNWPITVSVRSWLQMNVIVIHTTRPRYQHHHRQSEWTRRRRIRIIQGRLVLLRNFDA